jgi:predicted NAD-dependent protein-ADP-ribosyltransferase YbiA (DUF1768 family)
MTSKYIKFYSNAKAPYYVFSNFYATPVPLSAPHVTPPMRVLCPTIDKWLGDTTVCFPSSEHQWQALSKATTRTEFLAFAQGGAYTQWGAVFQQVFPALDAADLQRKIKKWKSKNMVGILAKMMGNRLRPEQDEEKLLTAQQLKDLWVAILLLKFRATLALGRLLKGTGDMLLYEFDKGARIHGSFWGAVLDPMNDTLIGHNMMGKYMVRVRAALRDSSSLV